MILRHSFHLALLTTIITVWVGAAAAQNNFSGGDLLNATYKPSCASDGADKPIAVKDGKYSYEKQEDGYTDRFYFEVFDIVYGDLTGDGKDEAVALTTCNTGGTGNFTEGFIFGSKNGKAVLLATLPGGDRAYGGIRKAWIDRGRLVVETNDPGELGAACCPAEIVTSTYKLAGKKLVESGKPTKRSIYPSQRVNFAKGKSEAVVKLTIRGDEGAELVLRANKGQTMTVTTNDEAIGAVLSNDAKITQIDNGFRAVLSETGDQSIRLDNGAAESVTVTVTIRIR
ncbi:MAG: hypothetical protein K1X52_00690 [Pyrinomonadaceae bacterium]|nr:hypothetical protein [Pyrinomonadaceae bacterium]